MPSGQPLLMADCLPGFFVSPEENNKHTDLYVSPLTCARRAAAQESPLPAGPAHACWMPITWKSPEPPSAWRRLATPAPLPCPSGGAALQRDVRAAAAPGGIRENVTVLGPGRRSHPETFSSQIYLSMQLPIMPIKLCNSKIVRQMD
uniref:Uncharacterized protein n=1 Tax=Rousettus aegyptiacus TaxID=9407 RepID=A0A7J8E9C2_ROUAE|nr:hypothetical protein HJG63_008264 [Rousettus aegyptiacus]